MSLSCITADSFHQTWFALCHYHTGRQVLTTKQGGIYVTIVHNGRFLPPNKVGFMSLSCIMADSYHQTWWALCHYHTGRPVLTTKQGRLYVTIVHNGILLPPNKVDFKGLFHCAYGRSLPPYLAGYTVTIVHDGRALPPA
jgi:hypothetical protein